jgi:hypothetical protein
MAKGTTDFAQQNAERALQATNYGMNWMREMAEQNLIQSRAAIEGFLTLTRKAVDGMDHQTAVICKSSMLFAEQTLSNTFDFAHKLVHIREPHELAQIQSDFVNRQAQMVGDQTKELGQRVAEGVNDVTTTTLEGAVESARRRAEAA